MPILIQLKPPQNLCWPPDFRHSAIADELHGDASGNEIA
jgi:hypothetical protein